MKAQAQVLFPIGRRSVGNGLEFAWLELDVRLALLLGVLVARICRLLLRMAAQSGGNGLMTWGQHRNGLGGSRLRMIDYHRFEPFATSTLNFVRQLDLVIGIWCL